MINKILKNHCDDIVPELKFKQKTIIYKLFICIKPTRIKYQFSTTKWKKKIVKILRQYIIIIHQKQNTKSIYLSWYLSLTKFTTIVYRHTDTLSHREILTNINIYFFWVCCSKLLIIIYWEKKQREILVVGWRETREKILVWIMATMLSDLSY